MTEKNNQAAGPKICWCFAPMPVPEPKVVVCRAVDLPYDQWRQGRRMVSCFPEVRRSTMTDFFHEAKVMEALLSAQERNTVEMGDFEKRLFRFGAQIENRDIRPLREYHLALRGLHFMREGLFLNQVNLELSQVAELFLKGGFVGAVLYGLFTDEVTKQGVSAENLAVFLTALLSNHRQLVRDFSKIFRSMVDAFADQPSVKDFSTEAVEQLEVLTLRLLQRCDEYRARVDEAFETQPDGKPILSSRFEPWMQKYVWSLDHEVGETFEKLSAGMSKALSRG